MKKNIVKIICFLLVFVLLFAGFYGILQYRFEDEDGIEGIKHFYTMEKDSIDVMCFGSSHMFVDVNTAVLWEKYGIAAYDLGGTIQPFWNTYYYMEEAMKTQHPDLLVVDCFAATLTEDYADESGIIKNTFGMKLSKNKVEAVKVSAPDHHLSYLLGYPGYHNRYENLGREDFAPNKGIAHYDSFMGNHFLGETDDSLMALRMDNMAEITDTEPIHQKEAEYLQKIIDLSKRENIPLLLIATPYFPTEREVKVFNEVAKVAAENEIPFINYNLLYDEIGLDFSTDFADGHHLNYKGSPKFTEMLGDYIKENYEIADRRGESGYEKYDVMTACHNQKVKNAELMDTEDLSTYLEKVDNDNYLVVYGLNGGFAYADNYAEIADKLSEYGIEPVADAGYQIYVVDQKDHRIMYSSNEQCVVDPFVQEWHANLGTYDVLSVRTPNEEDLANDHSAVIAEFNHKIYSPIYEGLTVFVYDKQNETMVECVGFYLQSGSISITKWR